MVIREYKLTRKAFPTSAFIACLYVLLVFTHGCVSKSQRYASHDQDHLLAVWRSNESSSATKVDAANRLIPIGSNGESVINLLGLGSGWNHYYGPGIDLVKGEPGKGQDFWTLEYPASDGFVFLKFHQVQDSSTFRVRFDTAFAGKRLLLKSGNKN